ncbi:hypothetical protein [Chryseobacterium sp.]|uniref:hypothetical protein n=1 Tax=Chryseobacterium sp. TaxID=1871047 RepID=UPI0011C93A20|nr:hypothetical protein [Chryseobacterium sp.]TXF77195.1 hypothetical protein FUA25_04455 [Chryseobacterium sp.]
MNETHLTQIRNYLLDKKLPIDILMEVQDHFVSQISDLEKDENLSFVEAFSRTKRSWDNELKPYWKGELNLEDVSDFMRKMKRQIETENFWTALKYSSVPLILILLAANFSGPHFFMIFTIVLLLGTIGYALVNYVRDFRQFRLAKKYAPYVLTLHQHSVFIFLVLFSPVINILGTLEKSPEKYQKILSFSDGFGELFFVVISLLIVLFGVFYSLLSQKQYLRQIEKVKPFLKYLKMS